MKTPRVVAAMVATCLTFPPLSLAEFQYTETTQITGGSVVGIMKLAGTFSKQAREANAPVVTTVVIKGNRMARLSNSYGEIVDLDKETVTHIDTVKKTYTVMTFQEMRQQIEAAAQKAQAQQKNAPAQPQPQTPPPDNNTKLNFTVNVRNTANIKTVAGLDSVESILTMVLQAQNTQTGETGNMAVTNDMWMAPEVPGYTEVRDFEVRYAQKMGAVFSPAVNASTLGALQPGSAEAMGDMVKEMSKLKGTPVLQIMRMGTTTNGQPLPAASEAPLPDSNSPQMPSAGTVAKDSVASALTSKFGLGGFGKKKSTPPPDQTQNTSQPTPQSVVLIESRTELASFSQGPVDVSKLEVPAGYQQVAVKNIQ